MHTMNDENRDIQLDGENEKAIHPVDFLLKTTTVRNYSIV